MRGIFDPPPSATVKSLVERVIPEMIIYEGGEKDDKWAEKMVRALYKKLKKRQALIALERAISLQDAHSECVPHPVCLDGKTTSVKKLHPHVYYVRIWRFPFIKSHTEIKARLNCQHPYEKKTAQICINPYHYELTLGRNLRIPPVIFPRMTYNMNPLSPVCEDILPQNRVWHRDELRDVDVEFDESDVHHREPDNSSFFHDSIEMEGDQSDYCMHRTLLRAQFSTDSNSTTSEDEPGCSHKKRKPNCITDQAQTFHATETGPDSPDSSQRSTASYENSYPDLLQKLDSALSPKTILHQDDPQNDLPRLASPMLMPAPPLPARFVTEDNEDERMKAEAHKEALQGPRGEDICVEYYEPRRWLTIAFHELGLHVSSALGALPPYITIDGYTAKPTDNRFCVNYFAPKTNDPSVVSTRRLIGKGCRIHNLGGEVFLECLSEWCVFVQSPLCNQMHGWPISTVCKVPPRCILKVFNNAEFAGILSAAVRKGFEAVYALARMCTMRVSFVKGWGAQYTRPSIDKTPCWIEFSLTGPLQWIDRVLSQMGAPQKVHSSYT